MAWKRIAASAGAFFIAAGATTLRWAKNLSDFFGITDLPLKFKEVSMMLSGYPDLVFIGLAIIATGSFVFLVYDAVGIRMRNFLMAKGRTVQNTNGAYLAIALDRLATEIERAAPVVIGQMVSVSGGDGGNTIGKKIEVTGGPGGGTTIGEYITVSSTSGISINNNIAEDIKRVAALVRNGGATRHVVLDTVNKARLFANDVKIEHSMNAALDAIDKEIQ